MLPYTKHPPAPLVQFLVNSAIPVFIADPLVSPIGRVGRRDAIVVGACVPKASVDEDRKRRAPDDNVGAARETRCEPVTKAGGPKRTPEPELRVRVLALDSGHLLGAGHRPTLY